MREAGGGGLEALVSAVCLFSGGEHIVQRRAAGEEGPRRGRRGRDDGVVRLEGHPAAGDVLGGEADGRDGVDELDGRWDQRLERRWRRRALGGRRWDGFRSGGVGGGGGLVAATVILAAAAAQLPGHEAQLLVLQEAHLYGGEEHHHT